MPPTDTAPKPQPVHPKPNQPDPEPVPVENQPSPSSIQYKKPPVPDGSSPTAEKISGNNIGWAMDQIHAGKEVTRQQWAGNATLSYYRPTERRGDGKLHYTHIGDGLRITNSAGAVAPFSISQEDLLAKDWTEAEEPEDDEPVDDEEAAPAAPPKK